MSLQLQQSSLTVLYTLGISTDAQRVITAFLDAVCLTTKAQSLMVVQIGVNAFSITA